MAIEEFLYKKNFKFTMAFIPLLQISIANISIDTFSKYCIT